MVLTEIMQGMAVLALLLHLDRAEEVVEQVQAQRNTADRVEDMELAEAEAEVHMDLHHNRQRQAVAAAMVS